MKSDIVVSVITPTYKRPEKLPRAIDSVLKQTFKEVEIIVVDDNNPDSEGRELTEQIMERYKGNPRVKYIKHEKNKNGSAARNTGARHSHAKYLAFLDDDDELLPDKIASQVKILEERDDTWGCCYSLAYTQKEGKEKRPILENREGDMYIEALAKEFSILAGSNLMVKRSVYDKVNGFDESFLRNQDLEFLARILESHKIAYCDIPGVIVYVHTERRNVNQEEVTNNYLTTFKPFIDKLPVKQQRYIRDRIYIQLFFRLLRSDHNYSRCLDMLLEPKFPSIKALCYTIKKIYIRITN